MRKNSLIFLSTIQQQKMLDYGYIAQNQCHCSKVVRKVFFLTPIFLCYLLLFVTAVNVLFMICHVFFHCLFNQVFAFFLLWFCAISLCNLCFLYRHDHSVPDLDGGGPSTQTFAGGGGPFWSHSWYNNFFSLDPKLWGPWDPLPFP